MTKEVGRYLGRIHDSVATERGLSFAVMATTEGTVGIQIHSVGSTWCASVPADIAARLGELLSAAAADALTTAPAGLRVGEGRP